MKRLVFGVPIGLFLVLLLAMSWNPFACLAAEWLGVATKKETVARLALALGGSLVALQAWASYRRAESFERTVHAQTIANETVERGQRQDRLRFGIDHLGGSSPSVRLGGAYELFDLGREFPDVRQSVLDILCSHVRQTTMRPEYREQCQDKPANEVQSLLMLLFTDRRGLFEDHRVDLSGSWLRGADLNGKKLGGASLEDVNLTEANLRGASLVSADLCGADLRGAQLTAADLRLSVLSKARLQGAFLAEARMQGSVLDQTQLQAAVLSYAELQGALLSDARMQGARLLETDFRGAGPREFDSSVDRIGRLVDAASDLSGVLFAGGLTENEVEDFVAGLSGEVAERIQSALTEEHVGEPESRQVPGGLLLGAYSIDDVEAWWEW